VTKRTSAKYKIDRRMGENIWGRAKSPLNKREYGPGQHGQRRKNKLSDFGTQLRAKQKLKGYYGDLTEKQFRRIYAEAERVKGDTGENLIGLLERRLDAIVYRAKFVPTIFAARQFVNHGHVTVNGQRVNIASYRVKEGDVIEVRQKSKQLAIVLEAVALADRVVLIEDGQIALDQRIDLPRPRVHGDAAFAALEKRILDRVLQKPGAEPAADPASWPGVPAHGLRWAI
jgi:small subunit ribosomal protein S4